MPRQYSLKAVLALAAAPLVSAQTWSLCNPVEGDDCPPNPAFGGSANFDFTGASDLDELESFFVVDGGIKYGDERQVSFDADTGMKMAIYDEEHAPLLISNNYLFFGRVEVELRAAAGRGIVTSIVLQSDSLDEVDWEFVGGDRTTVQSNYFGLGVEDFTRGAYHELGFDPMETFHTYGFDWTPEALLFTIDGNVVRTVLPEDGAYPQTPMQLRLGTWVGGKGDAQGTIDWAGGLAEWENAPFDGYYRAVRVFDYGGGHEAARSYEYTKGEGTWETIKVNGGRKIDMPESGSDFLPVDQNENVSSQSSEVASATSASDVSSASESAASSTLSSIVSEVSSIIEEITSSLEEATSSIPSSSGFSTVSSSSTTTTSTSGPTPTSDGSEDGGDGDSEDPETVPGNAGAQTKMSVMALGLAFFAGALMW